MVPPVVSAPDGRLIRMKIQAGNPSGQGGFSLHAGEHGLRASAAFLQAGLQSPVEALQALQQWRVKAEDTQKRAVRWPPAQGRLLSVWMAPHPEGGEDYDALIWAGFQPWAVLSAGAIGFSRQAFQNSPKAADIQVRWTDETVLGRDFEVGRTRREVCGKAIVRVEILLMLNPLIDAHLTPARQRQRLFSTVLHEAGHALGLEHSEDARDVMHHRGWQKTALTAHDVDRLRVLYPTASSLTIA